MLKAYQRIKELRTAKGWSQEMLAQKDAEMLQKIKIV